RTWPLTRTDELAGRVGDGITVDARGAELLRRRRRTGHAVDGELDDRRCGLPMGEDIKNGVAEPTLRPVVLDGDDAPGRPGRITQCSRIDRFHRVEVDH